MPESTLDLSVREQDILGALRQADGPWVPLWVLAKTLGCGWRAVSANVRGLRARGLIVKRPCSDGISTVEVSLVRSGL